MIGYDIAAHGTVLWLEQYDKATYRVRYNNTPGSFGYQRVVGYNAARSTTTITFLSSIPLHMLPLIFFRLFKKIAYKPNIFSNIPLFNKSNLIRMYRPWKDRFNYRRYCFRRYFLINIEKCNRSPFFFSFVKLGFD